MAVHVLSTMQFDNETKSSLVSRERSSVRLLTSLKLRLISNRFNDYIAYFFKWIVAGFVCGSEMKHYLLFSSKNAIRTLTIRVLHSFHFFMLCELQWLPGKYSGLISRCVLHGFEFRVDFLWLRIHTISKSIYAKVSLTYVKRGQHPVICTIHCGPPPPRIDFTSHICTHQNLFYRI